MAMILEGVPRHSEGHGHKLAARRERRQLGTRHGTAPVTTGQAHFLPVSWSGRHTALSLILYSSPEGGLLVSKRSGGSHVGRPRRAGKWVRKNMAMDPRKLALAKAYLGVQTETAAVDAALDLVALQAEVAAGLRAAA